ncbi:hypothetical protein [Haloferula sp. A504]|uniref:hypothetical protein n=1 Tax=Haloferula sp. A504 TaxID=3373601 RepID=UPI0031CAC757|nr:zinc-ribbon domain-containing protein [Verrucomicrobiaceae bacterium E54]
MDELEPEKEMVTIRCPGCGQRFKVGPELAGKMVECGTCDQRFRVEESVMIRTRKFYPGEQRDPSLQRFSRVPLRSSPAPSFDTVDPPPDPDPRAVVDPVSPSRVLLGLAGVTGAVIVALILIFGGGTGGILDGAPMAKRLILAGFTALIAWVLLFLANPAQRIKAVTGGLAISIVLLALPFLFTQGIPSRDDDSDFGAGPTLVPTNLPDDGVASPDDTFAELKEEMGYNKMAEALETYGIDGESQGKTAIGIWLRDTRLYNKEQIVDYLMRTTGAGPRSWAYTRPPSDYLMVLYDVSPELGRIRKLCERFGKVTRVIRELQVIEVMVDNDSFVQGPLNKLQDAEDPSFYELNRRELDSIDLHRASAAVRRLSSAEPRLFRTDIVRRMLELFQEGDLEMKENVARALLTWSRPEDDAQEIVRAVVLERIRGKESVPRSMVEFLVSQKDAESAPLLHDLWMADASEWETLYGDLGPVIEDELLQGLGEYAPLQLISAARLLGRVGTEASVPVLQEAQKEATSELRVTLEQAIRSIQGRQ